MNQVNVYTKPYKAQGETRYLLVIRQQGRKDTYERLGKVTKKQADMLRDKRVYQLRHGQQQRSPSAFKTFGDVCKELLQSHFPGEMAPSTLELYKTNLQEVCKNFGHVYLEEINPADIKLFLNQKTTWSGRTKNIALSAIRRVFNNAIELGYITDSKVHSIKRWREESVGSRSLTKQQLSQLLAVATPWQSAILTVLVLTGMRKGEALRLKFSDIDWEAHKLRIVSDHDRKTKSRKERVIPMSADLEKTLRLLYDHYPNQQYGCNGSTNMPRYFPRTAGQKEYVFCHADGRPMKGFSRSFNKLLEKANIEGVSPHGGRKTFCSLLAKENVHVKAAQRLMGHKDPRLTLEIYTEIQDDQICEAVKTLPVLSQFQAEDHPSEPKLKLIAGGK